MNGRVRAILIGHDKIILMKRVWDNRTYYVFPGGGIEAGESHEAALIRECQEELGIVVAPGALIATQEFRGEREYFYLCTYVSGELGTGDGPEFTRPESYNGTHEVVELTKEDLKKIELLPKKIAQTVIKKFFA